MLFYLGAVKAEKAFVCIVSNALHPCLQRSKRRISNHEGLFEEWKGALKPTRFHMDVSKK